MPRLVHKALLLSALMLALLGLFSAMAHAAPGPAALELYAHTDYRAGAFEGRILSNELPKGAEQSASALGGINFYLHPYLSRALPIRGTLQIKLWMSATEPTFGRVLISLSEVFKDGREEAIIDLGVRVSIGARMQPFYFYAPVEHIFKPGSTIRLSIAAKEVPLDVNVILYWGGRSTPTQVVLPVLEEGYVAISLRALNSAGLPVGGVNITIWQDQLLIWQGFSNSTGHCLAYLLRESKGAPYSIRASFRGIEVYRNDSFSPSAQSLDLNCKLHDLTLRIKDPLGRPLEGAEVKLFLDSIPILSGNSSQDGTFFAKDVPEGSLHAEVSIRSSILGWVYSPSQRFSFILSRSMSESLILSPIVFYSPYLALATPISILAAIVAARLRGKKPRPLDEILENIPRPSTVMIKGNSGSGKTLLLEHLASHNTRMGRVSVIVTTVAFPGEIREDMRRFGLSTDGRLIFVDCYSQMAGRASLEKYSVASASDLTGMAITISSCLSELKDGADLLFDSITPMTNMVKLDSLVNFVHAIGAKVKGFGGGFFFTIDTSAGSETLSKLEAISDGVIEMDAFEEGGARARRIRVAKMPGGHEMDWMRFKIEDGRGIVLMP
ncbi:MAG: ATPase domain-containing protein, partial [Candidatus Bathyarchaeia archaeon]